MWCDVGVVFEWWCDLRMNLNLNVNLVMLFECDVVLLCCLWCVSVCSLCRCGVRSVG